MKRICILCLLFCLLLTGARAEEDVVILREPDNETMFFGSYEQDGNAENGTEPIEWLILKKEDGRMLVMSRLVLDCLPYHNEWADVTWENCSLRAWLNDVFYIAAFSETERERILLTDVSNAFEEGYIGFDTTGGSNTQDYVFLLSYAESLDVFDGDYELLGVGATPAVLAGEKLWSDAYGRCWWWRRSPGIVQNRADVACGYGANNSMDVNNPHGGVRPAMWIILEETAEQK